MHRAQRVQNLSYLHLSTDCFIKISLQSTGCIDIYGTGHTLSHFFPFATVGFTFVDLSLLAFFFVCFSCFFCFGIVSGCSSCSVLALSLLVWPVVHSFDGCLYFLHRLQCRQSADACIDALYLKHSFHLVQTQALCRSFRNEST